MRNRIVISAATLGCFAVGASSGVVNCVGALM